jgi:hypothetical protein
MYSLVVNKTEGEEKSAECFVANIFDTLQLQGASVQTY